MSRRAHPTRPAPPPARTENESSPLDSTRLHPAEDSISFFGRQEQEIPMPPQGVSEGQVLGDYRLLRPIGQGGMGQVWEAEQLSLRRRVAFKLVRPERITPKPLDLFAREARAGGRLNHPGIVSVYGHGKDEGIAWIAMEFVDGSWTLRDFLDEVARRGELPASYDRAARGKGACPPRAPPDLGRISFAAGCAGGISS